MHTARIIALTQHPDMSPEELVIYCARVSNPRNQHNLDTAPKLMRYLFAHKHWSPFEMVSITMEITTTRDIARQILRHRSFSFQEFSQRYADPTQHLGFMHREARRQDPLNRQNSIADISEEQHTEWQMIQSRAIEFAELAYDKALALGIAKEQARAVLPEGLTLSRLYMAGTLRSWIHYCDVRTEVGTQYEHRLVAETAKQELCDEFKTLGEIWE